MNLKTLCDPDTCVIERIDTKEGKPYYRVMNVDSFQLEGELLETIYRGLANGAFFEQVKRTRNAQREYAANRREAYKDEAQKQEETLDKMIAQIEAFKLKQK